MNTTSQNSEKGLGSRTEQSGTNNPKAPLAQISFERRTANRMLGTEIKDSVVLVVSQNLPRKKVAVLVGLTA